jgi:hypothetical protein
VTRVAATLRGYANVARASEVLHLAPRSVRNLIYAGRLPSIRVGRLHYIKAADLDQERRRRLGLPLVEPRPRRAGAPAARRPRAPRELTALQPALPHQDAAVVRRQRAAERTAERAALVRSWAQRHRIASAPELPFTVADVQQPAPCAACHRELRRGRIVVLAAEAGRSETYLCIACGRRALLDWADLRRAEAAAARQLSQSLGEPLPEHAEQPSLLVA